MIQKFHAHVYFSISQIDVAHKLYQALINDFPEGLVVGKIYFKSIGPHPMPMFTLNFKLSLYDQLIEYLNKNRNLLTVLIHQDTGNDFRDHTEGTLWLGDPLIINFEHFERIKYEKSALVFSE